MESLEKAKLVLRKYLIENKDKVLDDLDAMRRKSTGKDIFSYVGNSSKSYSLHEISVSKEILFDFNFIETKYFIDEVDEYLFSPPSEHIYYTEKDSEISSESFFFLILHYGRIKKAAFVFKSFKIPYLVFDDSNHSGAEIKTGLLPSGRYTSQTGEFELTLKFVTYDKSNKDNVILALTAIAVFKFNKPIPYTEIPKFFYQNAIAILFPYVRAFVSTLTLQSNTKLLQLDLMNLSNLEEPLISNTVEI